MNEKYREIYHKYILTKNTPYVKLYSKDINIFVISHCEKGGYLDVRKESSSCRSRA